MPHPDIPLRSVAMRLPPPFGFGGQGSVLAGSAIWRASLILIGLALLWAAVLWGIAVP